MVGKPAEFMLANIAAKFGLRRDQICMVGDRLDTDILFGQHGGLTTMLVLSGAALEDCCGPCRTTAVQEKRVRSKHAVLCSCPPTYCATSGL